MPINSKENADKCPKCGGARTTGKAGTITQWIAGCTCTVVDEAAEAATEVIQICAGCGKRINPGRSGSFTQWIFRLDLCTCENPQPTSKLVESLTDSQSMEPVIFDTEEEEIDVDSKKFPKERYKPTAIIGKGASGAVYSCWDKLLNKKIALKTLNVLDENQIVKFQAEARATSMLSHPNIVQVLDFGVSEANVPYMAMEFIDGRSLFEHIETDGPLPLDSAIKIFVDVCNGLSHAHSKGVLHRDVKSSNLLVNKIDSEKPEVRVIDFGVAIVEKGEDSKGNVIAGSPAYMPPDSALGIEYNERSEVYGLGCTLFEALTGRPPFISHTALETIRKHAEEIPPLISDVAPEKEFPEGLVTLVDKCLSKNPDERFESMAQLKEELIKHLPEDIIEYIPEKPRTIEWTQLKSLSNVPKSLVVMVSVIAIGIGLTIMLLAMKKAEEPKEIPEPQLEISGLTSVLDKAIKPHFVKQQLASGKMSYRTKEHFKDEDLKQLEGDTEVDDLGLFDQGITDKGINKYVKGLKLRCLYLASKNITDRSVDTICSIEGLKVLDISRTAITDEGLKKIAESTGLTFLAFGIRSSDNDTLKIVSGLPSLEGIRITSISKADYRGYNNLSKLPKLEKIELYGCAPPPGSMRFLKNLKRLDSLIITKSEITESDITLISKLPLKQLEITRVRLTPKQIKILSKMKNLKSLNLTGCDLTDVHIAYLGNMTNLQTLTLKLNNLSNNGLKHIEKMKSLKSLDLTGCKHLKERAVHLLAIKLPKCKIKKFTDREKDNKAFAEVTNSILESSDQMRRYRQKLFRQK